MAKHGARHVRKTSVVGSMAVLVVVALVGYLVVTNLRVNKSATVSNDAAELIEHRVQRVDELQSEVNKLGSQIDDYNTLLRNNEMQSGNSEEAGQSTMLPAVTGPGRHRDAERLVDVAQRGRQFRFHRRHRQVRGASAGRRGGGGRAVGRRRRIHADHGPARAADVRGDLLGQRAAAAGPQILAAVHDLGNRPVDGMLQSLDDSRAIQIYKQYVDAFGLGYDVEVNRSLTFQRTPLVLNPLRYAKAFESGGSNESANGGQTTSATN